MHGLDGTVVRLYRGIRVPRGETPGVVEEISRNGFHAGQPVRWSYMFHHPGDIEGLFARPDLSTRDTRPDDRYAGGSGVCCCADHDSAAFYATGRVESGPDDCPVVVEFDLPLDRLSIDGRDFLYTVFSLGSRRRSAEALAAAYGPGVLRYAERAWSQPDPDRRIALCDLAIHDPAVLAAHARSSAVIAGRYRTHFRTAFIARLPVPPSSIVAVHAPARGPRLPPAAIRLEDCLDR